MPFFGSAPGASKIQEPPPPPKPRQTPPHQTPNTIPPPPTPHNNPPTPHNNPPPSQPPLPAPLPPQATRTPGGHRAAAPGRSRRRRAARPSGRMLAETPPEVSCSILWMDKILHQVKAMQNHCLLVFTRESSHGFLGVARFRPSTVCVCSKTAPEKK